MYLKHLEIHLEVIGVGLLQVAVDISHYQQHHFAQYFDIWLPLSMLILLTGCFLSKPKHITTLIVPKEVCKDW